MQGVEIKELLRRRPFEPIEMSLSDGRCVLIRHPDQLVVSRRHAILGLAQMKRGRKNVRTPEDGDSVDKDWMLVDLVHVVSVEPLNGRSNGERRKRRRKA